MASDIPALRIAIYLRVSLDRRKRRSVTQQDQGCRDELRELGHDPDRAAVYDDNDKSASSFSRKFRDNWARLLADVADGGIDFIIMWESSRGGRDDLPWIEFLRLCRDKGVLVHVVKDHRTYDVRKRQDYKDLAKQGIDNADYSSETSERVRRDKAWIREEGLPDGVCPFGWTRDYDPKTGELLRQRPDPEQVPTVARILDGIAEGEAIKTLAEETGLSRAMVRKIATNPVHIGRRYKPYTKDLHPKPGNWGVLYPGVEKTWWEVRRILADPARKTTRPGRAKYLVSHFATGVCGSHMGAMYRSKTLSYVCRDGCAAVKITWLDKYIDGLVIDRLCKRDIFNRAIQSDDAEVVAAQTLAAELQDRLDNMWDLAKVGKLSAERYTDAEAELQPQIDAAERKVAEAGLPPQLRSFIQLGKGLTKAERRKLVAKAWSLMPVAGRRDVVRLLFEYIRVAPHKTAERRGRPFELDESRILYDWRKSWT